MSANLLELPAKLEISSSGKTNIIQILMTIIMQMMLICNDLS